MAILSGRSSRLVATLLAVLQHRGGREGVAHQRIGGGESTTVRSSSHDDR
ncbi:hypothetical protein ABC974_18555 [Sphingomonas oligophenolica]|uniref:Uncharacterized protein n=1 Tax=Sphingomonas oligophenolica TaxID=301154 RepID=A0ABU9Y767_9SPHN